MSHDKIGHIYYGTFSEFIDLYFPAISSHISSTAKHKNFRFHTRFMVDEIIRMTGYHGESDLLGNHEFVTYADLRKYLYDNRHMQEFWLL